jgi:uncharacterized surface protein with fasciclin (FAS1) repeats
MKYVLNSFSASFAAILAFCSVAKADLPTHDIVDTAIGAGQFSQLVAAVQASGLVDFLKLPGAITVFAPTDAAFAKLPQDLVSNLFANPEQLRNLILKHIYKGGALKVADINRVLLPSVQHSTDYAGSGPLYYYLPMSSSFVPFACPSDSSNPTQSASLAGAYCVDPVPATFDHSGAVNNVKYVATDIETSNGIIQAIDTVL